MTPTHPHPYQELQDASHIRTLSIIHCVYGGLAILGGLGLMAGVILMLGFVSPAMTSAMSSASWPTSAATYASTSSPSGGIAPAAVPPTSHSHPSTYATTSTSTFSTTLSFTGSSPAGPPPVFTNMLSAMINIYALIYGLVGLFCITLGILCIVSARKMSQRKAQTFSLVIAGINCLFFPLGTTLGVFTFVVLLRASVAAEYRQATAEPPAIPGPRNP